MGYSYERGWGGVKIIIMDYQKPIVVLASASKSRYQLLKRLKLEFQVHATDIDETVHPNEQPAELAKRLSCAKARAVAGDYQNALIIGSDQCGEVDGQIIGKPDNAEQACKQLAMCSGKKVVFHTGLCLLNTKNQDCHYESVLTHIHYRPFTSQQAEAYVRIEQPFDCCGSHRSEGLGIALCERMESTDPSAMLGLPLIRLAKLLEEAGVAVLN